MTGVWPRDLRDGDKVLRPVHLWQAEHVLKRPCLERIAARPLMSLRTLAVPGGPHVKTALSAQVCPEGRSRRQRWPGR